MGRGAKRWGAASFSTSGRSRTLSRHPDTRASREEPVADAPHLIDLHSHLLPGVDDGSASPEQSAEVAARFWSEDVREICLTPHVLLSETTGDARAALVSRFASAYEALRAATATSGMRFMSGAEVMIDEPPRPKHDLGVPFTLGDSSAVLIEFPLTITSAAVMGTVRALCNRALIPLIAHPERYECCSPDAVYGWREAGAWIQGDATTAVSSTSQRGQRVRELMRYGLVDVLAGDNHGDHRSLGAAYARLVEAGRGAAAALVCATIPSALLSGAERPAAPSVEPFDPVATPKRIVDRVRRLFGAR